MSRSHVFLVVGALALGLGAAQLGGCTCTPFHMTFVGNTSKNGVDLPVTTTVRLSSAEAPGRLTLTLDYGSIEVAGDPAVTGVEAEFVVHEKVQGDASLALDGTTMVVRSAGGNPVLVSSAKVRVPPGTTIDVDTSFGSVTVTGIRSVASVQAKSEYGSVHLRDLAAVPRVTGSSSYGEVTMQNGAEIGELSLASEMGKVVASDVTAAKSVNLRSSFGSVTAEKVNAPETLTLRTANGSIHVEDTKSARATLRTDYGGVKVKSSTFDHLEANTSSGSVHLTGCTCKTKDLHTDFGSVKEE